MCPRSAAREPDRARLLAVRSRSARRPEVSARDTRPTGGQSGEPLAWQLLDDEMTARCEAVGPVRLNDLRVASRPARTRGVNEQDEIATGVRRRARSLQRCPRPYTNYLRSSHA